MITDDLYDDLIDSLPARERNKLLKRERAAEAQHPVGLGYWVCFALALLWTAVALPIGLLAMVFPPLGIFVLGAAIGPLAAVIAWRTRK